MSKSIASTGIALVGLIVCVAVIYTNSPIAPYINVDITVSISGEFYLAYDADDTLLANETVADTLFINLMQDTNNTKILVESGVYNITTATGIYFTNAHNVTVWGEDGTILREVKDTPTNATQLFSFESYSTNLVFRNIVFDQNKHDPNVLVRNDTVGYQWIGRFVGDTSASFYDCAFINGAESGLAGAGDGILLDHCVFYDIGEHPIYTSNLFNDWTVRYCYFLNWAKDVRGYGLKVTNGTNFYAHHNIFDHDEDGNGVKNDVPVGGGGSYLWVIGDSSDVLLKYNECYDPHLPIWIDGNYYYDATAEVTDGTTTFIYNTLFDSHDYHYEG